MEKMKTLTIGGVTYAVCAPLTEEEKQEVTGRVLQGISYEEILAPHKDEITAQAVQDVKAGLDIENQYAPIIEKTSAASKQGTLDDLIKGNAMACIAVLGESRQDGIPTTAGKAAITSLVNGQLQINGESIVLPQTLRGVPNADGEWVARDEIIAKDGKVTYIQRTGELTLLSAYPWQQVQLTSTSLIVGLDTSTIAGADVMKNADMLCDRFKVYPGADLAALKLNEATNNSKAANLRIKVPVEVCADLAAWKAWLDDNVPQLVYIRNTPVETDITATETGASLLDLLRSHITFSWHGDVPMSFTYRADTTKALQALQEGIDAANKRLGTLNSHENVRVIVLGDSITAAKGDSGWTTHFLHKINGEMLANAAVSGAQLADAEGNSNVLSSQVDTLTGEDVDYDPDVILIAIGTNGGIHITQEDMVAAYYSGFNLIPLENVDRKTHAGAFRYASEKLHDKYPDAVIFWCSPVHRVRYAKTAEDVRAWHESLRIATEYTGQQHIDTIHCGINSAYEKVNAEGECLADGLHPNEKGAKKIGYYIAGKVNAAVF